MTHGEAVLVNSTQQRKPRLMGIFHILPEAQSQRRCGKSRTSVGPCSHDLKMVRLSLLLPRHPFLSMLSLRFKGTTAATWASTVAMTSASTGLGGCVVDWGSSSSDVSPPDLVALRSGCLPR